MKDGQFLFDKPQGPSKKDWKSILEDTSEDIKCDGCGMNYIGDRDVFIIGNPEYKSKRHYYVEIIGKKLVLECCGAAVDKLSERIIDKEQILSEVFDALERDPLNPKYHDTWVRIETLHHGLQNAASASKADAIKIDPHPDLSQ